MIALRSAVAKFFCVFLFLQGCSFAQQNAQARPVGDQSSSSNRTIALDVAVDDQTGQSIRGLQQSNFTLLDDKQPQPLISFRAVENPNPKPDPPVEVVLVVDEVNTSFHDVATVRHQVELFLAENNGKLAWPTSLVFFTPAGALGGPPSQDGKALTAELNQRETALRGATRSQGLSGAVERINLSLRTLGQLIDYQANRPGRKLVIWISPGWSLLSTPRVELSSKDQEGLFASIVGISNGMQKAHVTVYNVNPTGSGGGVLKSYYKDFIKGVKSANQVRIGNLALQVIAYQSGGLILNSSNDLAGEITTCVNDGNAFYVLTFQGAVGDGPNDYHTLEVRVDRPGEVRTRSGYYAEPERANGH